jgi:predicted transcriptional regulator of viral defense system
VSQSISRREAQLIDEIKDREMLFFQPKDVQRFLDVSDRASYNMVSRMKNKDLVESIESGKYVLKEILDSRDVYELASNIVDYSYLGFFSALHFHDLTEQVPQKVQVAVTKRKDNLRLQGREIQFIKIDKDHFFGYSKYGNTVASTPEKTVIDSLRLPGKTGDLSNILDLDYTQFDTELLVDYAVKTGSSTVASRLGLILEKKGIDFNTERLVDMITHYTSLDSQKPDENPVNKWKIYENCGMK